MRLKQNWIILPLIGFIISITSANLFGQCGMMMGHGGHSGHSDHNMQSTLNADTTLIRKGTIDVYQIDLNMDGFVFQDPMHWNVISDNPANCPICGMELKKTKIKEAIKNLKENNFEVKNNQGESK